MRKELEKVEGEKRKSKEEVGEIFSSVMITLEVLEEEDVGEWR